MFIFDALERKVLVASGFQGEGAFSRRLARAFSGLEFALAALREHFLDWVWTLAVLRESFLDQNLLSQYCESLFLIGISSRNPARAFSGLALGSRSTVRAFSGLGLLSRNSAQFILKLVFVLAVLFN